ncbi:MAG: oxidoreductase [Phycisphaerae bacterium]|jgi:NAD(P)H-flavin reductase
MSTATLTRPEPICGSETMFPVPVQIVDVHEENFNTRTFTMRIEDATARESYRWIPGQFNMIYVPGVGEAAISISADPEERGVIGHTIRVVGSVTRAINRMGKGGMVGLRGPFGRGWPLDQLDGGDIVLVAGGIGLAPLRPVVYWLLRNRPRFRRVMLLYGCRTPEDRLYGAELDRWSSQEAIDVLVTVDNATSGWVGPVGVVTKLLQRIKVYADRTTVMVCGPRMLNRAAAWSFLQLHVPPERLFLSLERNMHCGFGQCGHCQYGSKFVCKDGPVFAFNEIADIFAKEEI